MFTATVVTGNHYFIDGVLGVMVCSISFLVARKLMKSRSGLPAAVSEPDQAPSLV
jgi:hypothetical protein